MNCTATSSTSRPKKIEGKKRYFQGRIWVDDHDLQIVKTYGKTVPDIRNKTAERKSLSQIHHLAPTNSDGPYWFPLYTERTTNCISRSGDVKISAKS